MSSRAAGGVRRLAASRAGTVAVEFAIVGLIFITLMLGAVDLARFQIIRQSLRSIVEDAARTALITSSVNATQAGGCAPSLLSGAALRTAVTTPLNPAPLLTPAKLNLTASCATNANGARTITVTASYPFAFIAPGLRVGPNLSSTAVMSY